MTQPNMNKPEYEGLFRSIGEAFYGKKDWEKMNAPPPTAQKSKGERLISVLAFLLMLEVALGLMFLVGYAVYLIVLS